MTPQQAYKAGDLSQAMTLAIETVKHNPSDIGARVFFAELCCIVGDLERADKQLQTLLTLAPELGLTASNWRQLIRAAFARTAVYREGATPTLVSPATPAIELALANLLAIRDNQTAPIGDNTGAADQPQMVANLQVNGKPVQIMRDLDDINATVLEFLGSNGNYFWVDLNQVESLTFEPPQRPLDLLWRKCNLTIASGSDGVVFMPTIYPHTLDDSQQLLGKSTAWHNRSGLELGLGLREFLVDDDILSVMEIDSITQSQDK